MGRIPTRGIDLKWPISSFVIQLSTAIRPIWVIMPRDAATILKLRVPVIVRIGHRQMKMDDVLSLGPGAIIELPQASERPLDLMVSNKVIGHGNAVKIGENFGIKVLDIGSPAERVNAVGSAIG